MVKVVLEVSEELASVLRPFGEALKLRCAGDILSPVNEAGEQTGLDQEDLSGYSPLELAAMVSLVGNLPPDVTGWNLEDVQENDEIALRVVMGAGVDTLKAISTFELGIEKSGRIADLCVKEDHGSLDEKERVELAALEYERDMFLKRRALARLVMHWRGVGRSRRIHDELTREFTEAMTDAKPL